jgi:hypothetical protein
VHARICPRRDTHCTSRSVAGRVDAAPRSGCGCCRHAIYLSPCGGGVSGVVVLVMKVRGRKKDEEAGPGGEGMAWDATCIDGLGLQVRRGREERFWLRVSLEGVKRECGCKRGNVLVSRSYTPQSLRGAAACRLCWKLSPGTQVIWLSDSHFEK